MFLTIHVVLLLLICIMTKTLFGSTAMKAGLIPDNKKIAKEKKEAAEQEKVEQENAEREIPSQPEQEVDLPEENRSVQV